MSNRDDLVERAKEFTRWVCRHQAGRPIDEQMMADFAQSETTRLRTALAGLVDAVGRFRFDECDNLSHKNGEFHRIDDECPVESLVEKVIKAAKAALDTKDG